MKYSTSKDLCIICKTEDRIISFKDIKEKLKIRNVLQIPTFNLVRLKNITCSRLDKRLPVCEV